MFQTLVRTAIEIKVSEADFNRDTWEKRRAWQRVCHRFVYVVPADLPVLAPWKCGLWRVGPDGRVVVAQRATVNLSPEPLPQAVVQTLAYRAARCVEPAASDAFSRSLVSGEPQPEQRCVACRRGFHVGEGTCECLNRNCRCNEPVAASLPPEQDEQQRLPDLIDADLAHHSAENDHTIVERDGVWQCEQCGPV
jgi:hypothetical protein